MTIAAGVPVDVISTAGGAQTVFTFTFEIFDEDHLKIKTISDLGVIRDVDNNPYIIVTDYTVAGVGADAGGTLTTLVAIPINYTVVLYRETPMEHLTADDFPTDIILATTLNSRLDKIMALLQEHDLTLDQCIKIDRENTIAPDSQTTQMPSKTLRASKLVGFDANGDPTVAANLGAIEGLTIAVTNDVLEFTINGTLGFQIDVTDSANPVTRAKASLEGDDAFVTP